MNAEPINVLLSALEQSSSEPEKGLQMLATIIAQSRTLLAEHAEHFVRLAARIGPAAVDILAHKDESGLTAALLTLPEAMQSRVVDQSPGSVPVASAREASLAHPLVAAAVQAFSALSGVGRDPVEDLHGSTAAQPQESRVIKRDSLRHPTETRWLNHFQGMAVLSKRITPLLTLTKCLAVPLVARMTRDTTNDRAPLRQKARAVRRAIPAGGGKHAYPLDVTQHPSSQTMHLTETRAGSVSPLPAHAGNDDWSAGVSTFFRRLMPRSFHSSQSALPVADKRNTLVHQLLAAGNGEVQTRLATDITRLSQHHYQTLSQRLDLPAAQRKMDAAGGGRLPWDSELSLAQQPRAVAIQQETNIYLQGTSDPQCAADSVVNSQFDVNSQLIQRLQREPI